jgi:4'-phosphopantetheinyl transferase
MSAVRCHVWWARPATESPRLVGLLDEIEHGRHEAYQRPVDRARFLTGRVVAKALVGLELGIEPAQVVLDSSCTDCGRPHGKPRVVRPEEAPPDRVLPELSISHSGEWVAVAVTDGLAVGVDVEELRDVRVSDLAHLTFSPAEQQAFEALPEAERRPTFFTCWARKEALLKATGRGLSIAMTKVTITPATEPPRLLAATTSEVDVHNVRMRDLEIGADYRASVAVLGLPDGHDDDWVDQHDADKVIAELA